jgi:hypothetical protein
MRVTVIKVNKLTTGLHAMLAFKTVFVLPEKNI